MDDVPQTDDVSQLLQYAVEKGRTDIVRALLEQGALEQIKTAGGTVETPALHTACRLGHEDVVRALLSSGVDPTISWEGQLALETTEQPKVQQVFSLELFTATARGDAERVQLLLDSRVNVDADDATGALNTPLHWAASFGAEPVVQTLLQAGATCDICNSDGITALHEASKGGHPGIVAALLEAKADVSIRGTARTWKDKTALQVTRDERVLALLTPLAGAASPTTEHNGAVSASTNPNTPQPPKKSAAAIPPPPPPPPLFKHADYCLLWPRPKRVRGLNLEPVQLLRSTAVPVVVNGSAMNEQLLRAWRLIEQQLLLHGCTAVMSTVEGPKEVPAVRLKVCPELFSHREAYKLQVRDNGIHVTSADEIGLFYGVLTLVQLFKHYATQTNTGVVLPPVLVTDWPDLCRRGAMLDLRTKCPGLTKLCSTAEMMSSLKVNEMHLYLESCYSYAGHPTVQSVGTGLNAADLVTLRQHCHRLGITLVLHQASRVLPSWLQQAEYRDLAQCPQSEQPQTLALNDSKSIELVDSLFEQLSRLPSDSQLLGAGLEADAELSDGAEQSEPGTDKTYTAFVNSTNALLVKRNRTMLWWGDSEEVLAHPDDIPESSIVMVRGLGNDPHSAYESCCSKLADADIGFYVAMPTPGWTSMNGHLERVLDRIGAATTKGMKYGAIGGLVVDFAAIGSEALVDDMATSLLGVLVSVGCMWNGSTAQLLDQGLLSSLVASHLLGSSSQEAAAKAIISISSAHVDGCNTGSRRTSLEPSPSSLMKLLIFQGDSPSVAGLELLSLKRTSLVLKSANETLAEAPEEIRNSLEVTQVTVSADLQLFACRLGLALMAAQDKAAGDAKVVDIPKLIRNDLLEDLQQLRVRARMLWKKRHHLAGCIETEPNSTAGLDHLERLLAVTLPSSGSGCVVC